MLHKKNILSAARVFLLHFFFATCAWAEPLSFVMEPFPPFIVDRNGNPEGPFPDAVKAVCESMKTECKLALYPWRRAYHMAVEGAVDGIVLLTRLPEREKDFYFTDPVFQSSISVLSANSNPLLYTGPKNLEGYTIGTYGPSGTSSAAEEVSKQTSNARLEIEVDNLMVLRKLSANRYGDKAVAVVNRDVAALLMAQDGITNLRVAGDIKQVGYAIGLSRKKLSQQQAEQFISAMRMFGKSGGVKAIANKYGVRPAP